MRFYADVIYLDRPRVPVLSDWEKARTTLWAIRVRGGIYLGAGTWKDRTEFGFEMNDAEKGELEALLDKIALRVLGEMGIKGG